MRKIILATAYDVNPYKGSESATGWNFIIQIARFNRVIAVTRKNNRKEIERYIQEFNVDVSNIDFFYFDLPYYLRFWKKGSRGATLYFYLWQMFIPIYIKKKKITFDIAHNVNFHADAIPSFLWVLNKPFVWGPINHHEKIPKEYIYPEREYFRDRIKWVVKKVFWNLDPFIFLAKFNSDIIIGGNRSVQKRLSIGNDKFKLLSQVASDNVFEVISENGKIFNILIAARFVALKGVDIALLAFEDFYNDLSDEDKRKVKLTILGKGPLEKDFLEIRKKFNSNRNIESVGWVNSESMNSIYRNSSVFLFPSHEGAGMVVVEALSNGLPVICFDNFGPGELIGNNAGLKIPYSSYMESIKDFSNALKELYVNESLYLKLSEGARSHFESNYTWNKKGQVLAEIYNSIL